MSLIYKKIPAIMNEVGAIEKGRKNASQGYAFRGIEDFYFAMQPILAKHGVFCAPSVLRDTREERQTKSGTNMIYTVLTMEFTFYAEDGSSFKVSTVGEASDAGDKSAAKAMSTALKYAFMQLFCVPTEEDAANSQLDTERDSPEILPKFPAPAKPGPALKAVSDPTSPGAYVIKVGQKWIGKSLAEIGAHDAEGYGKYLRKSAAEKGKPLTGDWLEAANAIDAFVNSRDVGRAR